MGCREASAWASDWGFSRIAPLYQLPIGTDRPLLTRVASGQIKGLALGVVVQVGSCRAAQDLHRCGGACC